MRAVARFGGVFLGLLLLGPVESADAFPAPKFSLAAGYGWPAAPGLLTDLWGAGPAATVGVSFRIDTRASIAIEAGAYRLPFDTGTYEAQIATDFPGAQVSGNDVTIFPVTVGGEYSLTGWGNTRPYVAAGLGFYQVSVSDATVIGAGADSAAVPDLSDQAFGMRGGVGVRTLITPSWTLFADVTLHYAWVSPDPVAFVPFRIGLRF